MQDFWNDFENKLAGVIDNLIPVSKENKSFTSIVPPPMVKNKINLRKRLLKRNRLNKNPETKQRINELNIEIRKFFNENKSKQVRRTIKPGDSQSLWKAVRNANDTNTSTLPKCMFLDGIEISNSSLPDSFASHFDSKISALLNEVSVDDSVYNGDRKVNAINSFFMDKDSVRECIISLKTKNSEGFDRIPQRILIDGVDYLLEPLTCLFKLIYEEKKVPDQWLAAKTIPIFKNKGQKKDIENYRPIANLCATSKIFEKLVLKRILEIQDNEGTDLTGDQQHGFKRKRSTSTLSSKLLSEISRALDDDDYVLTTSIDLSSAFDLVNVDLLIKRLIKIGLPEDLIELIESWLKNRSYYVSIDGEDSILYDLLLGTVQGSILGPVLYAIFVSPLFKIADLELFADDSFITKSNESLTELIKDMEKSLEAITKWLKQSGMKVNQNKTEAFLFYKQDIAPIQLKVGNARIQSKKSINVLGVIFDSKLKWENHVLSAIKKANRSLNAIRLIRKFFNRNELLALITSNFYSILFYNSEVWLSMYMNDNIKHKLFVASAKALKVCQHYPDPLISFIELHKISKRATPMMISEYKCALQLYKTFNECQPINEWVHLNFYQVNTSRQTKFLINRSNRTKIGRHSLCNRFHQLNGKIPLEWLGKSYLSYKILCKNLFLSFHDVN